MKNKLNCILLIDDDEPTNFLTRLTLEEMDCANVINTVENGVEALAYLNKTMSGDPDYPRPDLIFLDINMPAMNGWEFLEQYARIDVLQKANVVIVMLTTSLNPDDRNKAEKNPDVTGFELKPLLSEKVKGIIETYFREGMLN
jgi:CheY-like chemotaxis protein